MKKINGLILSMIILFSISCKENQSTASSNKLIDTEKVVKKAKGFFKERKYKKVIKLLLRLSKEKHNRDSLILLGESYVRLSKYSKGLPYIEKSLEFTLTQSGSRDNEKAKAHSLLAFTYQKLKKYELALKHYTKTAEFLPTNHLAWTNLGSLYLEMDKPREAKKAYLKARHLKANYKTTLAGLGDANYRLGKYDESVRYYNQLLEQIPNSSKGHIGLGKALVKKEQEEQGYEMIAKGYYLSQKYKEALEQLGKVSNLFENKDLVTFKIAILMENQNFNEALITIKKAAHHYPNEEEFAFDLAQLYFRQKKYNHSLKQSLGGLTRFPKSYLLKVVAANSYSELDQKEKAIPYYEEALKIKERDIQTRERLAQVYRESGQKNLEFFHQGVVYYYHGNILQANEVLSWINHFAREGELSYYKGLISLRQNKTEDAISFFNTAIKKEKELYMPYLELANTYKSMNQLKKGAEVLKQFMDNNPGSRHFDTIKEHYNQLIAKK